MSEEEDLSRLHTDPEFVLSKRHENSISKLEQRYPDGCPNNVIAAVMKFPDEDAVEAEYNRVVVKMRELMGIQL